ncbi:MAG: ribonuclease P protein component [Rhodospirillaceae bacterium]|nr:ribonuclease P protein component [Rhodospirillaceae bacterium]MBT6139716.1 ribonuclease P protein component [Rhodospirillaceae bacterium]
MRERIEQCPSRLTRRPEYLRVARGRRKAVTPGIVVQARARDTGQQGGRQDGQQGSQQGGQQDGDGKVFRVGFTASRKVGNAVARNRARRRLKAVASDVMQHLAKTGTDYVLIARGATVERAYDDLLGDLRSALRRLHKSQGLRESRGSREEKRDEGSGDD